MTRAKSHLALYKKKHSRFKPEKTRKNIVSSNEELQTLTRSDRALDQTILKKRTISFTPLKSPKRRRFSPYKHSLQKSSVKSTEKRNHVRYMLEASDMSNCLSVQHAYSKPHITSKKSISVGRTTKKKLNFDSAKNGVASRCDEAAGSNNEQCLELETTVERLRRLVKQGKYSTSSISFKLFEDTLKWYDCCNTSAMRYSEETKEFFWTGKHLLGGQFIRFMRGYTNEGHIKEQHRQAGYFNPGLSDINLPVPADSALREFQPRGILVSDSVKPGILHENIQAYGLQCQNVLLW